MTPSLSFDKPTQQASQRNRILRLTKNSSFSLVFNLYSQLLAFTPSRTHPHHPPSPQANILPFDLSEAADELGIDPAELVNGLHDRDDAHELSGVLASPGQRVNFSVRESKGTVALLSCASRKGSLDSSERPKAICPMQILTLVCDPNPRP